MSSSREPVSLSLVIPLYQVERYLPELLASLSKQKRGPYHLETVFVDDGSPDRSGDLAEAWLEKSSAKGVVIRQENKGVSAARNVGLSAAAGEWVSFPDSDDVLDVDYCNRVAQFMQSPQGHASTIVSANVLRLDDRTGRVRNRHALRFRFAAGSRVVSLNENPDFFQLNAATAFFRRQDLTDSGVRFVEGLHASEDALFVAEYLLGHDDPQLGLVREAKYHYRKRLTSDSAVDRYRDDPDSYIARFRDGYLPLFERAREKGSVPGWLQSMLLYEYQWIFPPQQSPDGHAAVLDSDDRAAVRKTVIDCLQYVDTDRIVEYDATLLPVEVRFVLLAMKGSPLPDWCPVYCTRVDDEQRLALLRYYTTDAQVSEAVRVGTIEVDPPFKKTRQLDYFGQEVLFERLLWVPAGRPPRIEVNGRRVPVVTAEPGENLAQLADRQRRVAMDLEQPLAAGAAGQASVTKSPPHLADAPMSRRVAARVELMWEAARRGRLSKVGAVRAAASRPRWRREFADAWVFMDHPEARGGMAEELFRYVSETHPEINAWLVVTGGTPHASRLANAGASVLEAGSLRHHYAMLNARHLVSSFPEAVDVIKENYYLGRRPWRFTLVADRISGAEMTLALNRAEPDLVLERASSAPFDQIPGSMLTERETPMRGCRSSDEWLQDAFAAIHGLDRPRAVPQTFGGQH